jgi:outer membrane lipoprotein SlyB
VPRFLIAVLIPLALAGCGPSYSPDTYSANAVQQANKVDPGVIIGVRPVAISAQGTVGATAGAAAGGVAGSEAGAAPVTRAMGAIGGSLLGGLAGLTAEHVVADTNGFEYIVKKPNGDLVSVAQKDEKPLRIGQKVLVIAGPQARIVPDYTVPFDTPAKPAVASAPPAAAPVPPAAPEAKPAQAGPVIPLPAVPSPVAPVPVIASPVAPAPSGQASWLPAPVAPPGVVPSSPLPAPVPVEPAARN